MPLVGSVGLIAAVPLTTALAAAMCPPRTALSDATAAAGSSRDEAAAAELRRPVFDEQRWAERAARAVSQDDE